MISTSRPYHALTGVELKQAILNEVGRALDNAGINSPSITYPQCTWSWSLHVNQKDAEGKSLSDTPERDIKAGTPGGTIGKLINALGGGSKRFQNDPPSPTEVRVTEKLPLPEA